MAAHLVRPHLAAARGGGTCWRGGAAGPRPRFAGTAATAPTRRLPLRLRSAADSVPPPSGGGDGEDEDAPPPTQRNQLETTIKRKQVQLNAQMKEMGMEALEERLQSSVQTPASPPYRLTTMVAEYAQMGRAVLVFEVCRSPGCNTSEDLAKLARQYVKLGADALVVRTDAEDTPAAFKDLFAVTRAVKVPVLARDWIIHPMQIAEAKEAGAAGVLGVIHQVNGRGTAIMSSFASAIGLDAPVEVVNTVEVEALSASGVVFYGINLSVGLSLAVPSFAKAMAKGLLGQLPFGAVSMVGVRSFEDARTARMNGADSLLVKKELIESHPLGIVDLFDNLQYIVSGDD